MRGEFITTRDTSDGGVRALHGTLIESWNEQDADRYAAQFTKDGNVIGFDGSMVDGAAASC